MTGIIVKALSGFYYVKTEEGIYTCKARGNFRQKGVSPLVGDRVEITASPDFTGAVESIMPRKTCLNRPPVANIEKLFILSSYENPAPNTTVIDKLTVIARHKGIEPIIVFNKKEGVSPPNSSETNIKAGARKCTQLSKPAASNTV